MTTIWREPDEESTGLYPKLVVHDGRVSGSITCGRSRLPLWAFIWEAVHHGWESVESSYGPLESGFNQDDLAEFLHHLLEMRGEFGRLLLVLANADRLDARRNAKYFAEVGDGSGLVDITPGTPIGDGMPLTWWQNRRTAKPIINQLKRCLAALEASQ